MDINHPRVKKGKPHNARPYDRPNQSILGKVASKVKGLFNPSWLFNALRTNEEEVPCSEDVDEETQETEHSDQQIELRESKKPRLVGNRVRNNVDSQPWLQPGTSGSSFGECWPTTTNFNEVPKRESSNQQTELRGSKRPRLKLGDTSTTNQLPSKTWLQPGTSKELFHCAEQRTSASFNQVEIDEQPVINGDDRSENSEGSASTSGCSSLVSSHKDRLNSTCLQMSEKNLQNLCGQLKAKSIFQRTRQDSASYTERMGRSKNTSAWPCGNLGLTSPARSPSVLQSTKPSFNFTTFSGPSKIVTPASKKQPSSPFYEGKTTYGGASSSRRMPFSVAPYQTERSLRNQTNVTENRLFNNPGSNNSECMSSAAKRILQTLEKMSTPIMDAKKIPNTSHSPVDLSIYLTPPSHRKSTYLTQHSKQTPKVPNKGPPIANINTIARLTTMKNISTRRHDVSMDIPFVDKRNLHASTLNGSLNSSKNYEFLSPDPELNKGGGGKMKSTLNQRTHFSSKGNAESEVQEEISLPDVPLPITSLPTFNLGGAKTFANKSSTSETVAATQVPPFTFASPNPIVPDTSLFEVNPKDSLGFEFSIPAHIDDVKTKLSTPIGVNTKFSVPVRIPTEHKEMEDCSTLYSNSVNDFLKTLSAEDKTGQSSDGAKIPQDVTDKSSKRKSSSRQHSNESLVTEKAQKTDKGSKRNAFVAPSISTTPNSVKNSGQQSDLSENSGNEKSSTPLRADSENSASVENIKESCSVSSPAQSNFAPSDSQAGFGQKFQPERGSWECSVCMVRNQEKNSRCVACETPNPSSHTTAETTATKGFGQKFQPERGSWECSVCMVRNQDKTSKCVACETPNPLSHMTVETTTIKGDTSQTQKTKPATDLIETPKGIAGSRWECDTCFVRNPQDKDRCIACETLRASKYNTGYAGGFQFSLPSHCSPIAFSSGTLTSTSQDSSGFKFGIPSSVTSTPSNSNTKINSTSETLTVTSSGFKIETKDSPLTTNFGGFILKPNPTIEVGEKKNAEIALRHPNQDGDNLTVDNKHTTDSKVLKSSDVTPVINVDEPVISESVSTSKSSSQNSFFVAPPVSIAKKDSSENSNVTSKPFQFGIPSAQASLKTTSDSFLTDTSKVKSTDSFIKTTVASSAPVFGSFIAKDIKRSPIFPKMGEDSKTILGGGKTDGKESSSTSEANKNSFKFVAPLPVAPGKPSFGFPAKSSEVTAFSFVGNSNPAKTTEAIPKLNPLLTSTSSFSAVNPGSGFKFADNSLKPLVPISSTSGVVSQPAASSAAAAVLQSKPSVTFQGNVAKGTEMSAPSAFAVPSPATTSSSSFSFGNNAATVTPSAGFSFFPSSTAANPTAKAATSGMFSFGANSGTVDQQKPGGFTFKAVSEEKGNPLTSSSINYQSFKAEATGTSAPNPTATAASTLFKFGGSTTSTTSSTGGFVFGATKTEPATSAAAPFVFGSSTSQSGTTNAFPVFQQNQTAVAPAAPSFQFGSVTNNPAVQQSSGFGTQSSAFSFGAPKSVESVNQMPSPMSQNPAPTFGSTFSSMQPIFGGAATPTSTPSNAGFNFAPSAAQSPVFRFGAQQEETVSHGTASPAPGGFNFGATATETPSSFATPGGFTMNTPPSFNFGATSTPAGPGPFQFGASSGTQNMQNAAVGQRKIRKAVRKMNR